MKENKRLAWREYLDFIADRDSFCEINGDLTPGDPIEYPAYPEKAGALRQALGIGDAIVTGRCAINAHGAAIGIMDSRFLMGSMGSVVGEKIVRLFEFAQAEKLPVIIVSSSGGARMQEGIFSLFQMAKTAGAVARFGAQGGFFISVQCDPTTGGVTASFSSLGDIIIAEKGAMIGFAGPVVVSGTTGYQMDSDFQTAEFVLRHGFADILAERSALRDLLSKLIRLHTNKKPVARHIDERASANNNGNNGNNKKILSIEERWTLLKSLTRPGILDYLPHLFDDWTELHGDRSFGDDGAMLGGIAALDGLPVTVIAQVRGRTIEEAQKTNFSMVRPEGYRKALRLAKQAEKFARPVLCFIDTPGADCGAGAEERGQAEAIARCLAEFMTLKTPVISVILGWGGSGGALAIDVCDRSAILENSLFFVISPRGFASILWKDGTREKEALPLMKITAQDMVRFGVCQELIDEAPISDGPAGIVANAKNIKNFLLDALAALSDLPPETLVETRYTRHRDFGCGATGAFHPRLRV
jgi:acetyl-CoA carboxylase carboxyl transferase subunit beta